MALRKPDLDSGGDYSTYEMRDLRDAVNEYILAELENSNDDRASTNRIFTSIIARLEALEAKMVDNTPKGGYNLKSEGK